MGTVFSLDVRDGAAQRVLPAVVALLHRLDALCSTYRPDSEVSRLRRGELPLADCDPDVQRAADLCEEARRRTGGWFDARTGIAFDPSGVVKGWAVERAGALLEGAGCTRWCVNGGGDVAVGLGPEPGRPWRVGIADPHDRTRLLGRVAVESGGVATSGTAERGGHVLDPRTGAPSVGLASVTVVAGSLLEADVLATAALAAGPVRAPGVLAEHPLLGWLLVAADGGQRSSPGWPSLTG